jgi:hypothetical protein
MWQMVLLLRANYMWWYEFVIVNFDFIYPLFVLDCATLMLSQTTVSVYIVRKETQRFGTRGFLRN